jgi:hypothetical protein
LANLGAISIENAWSDVCPLVVAHVVMTSQGDITVNCNLHHEHHSYF